MLNNSIVLQDKDIALEFKRIFERCQEELQQVNSGEQFFWNFMPS